MTSDQTSLRDLAKLLGCSHTALGKAVREGRLTKGVRIRDGVVEVTDAKAAVRQWHDIHVPRTDELIRLDRSRSRSRQEVPAPSSRLAELLYRHDWTVDELGSWFEAHELLAYVLIKALVAGKKVALDTVAALVHQAAPLRFGDDGYDAATADQAEWLLGAYREEIEDKT